MCYRHSSSCCRNRDVSRKPIRSNLFQLRIRTHHLSQLIDALANHQLLLTLTVPLHMKWMRTSLERTSSETSIDKCTVNKRLMSEAIARHHPEGQGVKSHVKLTSFVRKRDYNPLSINPACSWALVGTPTSLDRGVSRYRFNARFRQVSLKVLQSFAYQLERSCDRDQQCKVEPCRSIDGTS